MAKNEDWSTGPTKGAEILSTVESETLEKWRDMPKSESVQSLLC